jgi:hypothetical protein
MTNTLYTRKRSRSCRTCKDTGQRDCAAAKLDLAPCEGACRGKEMPLVSAETLQQREYLTRHLRPMSQAETPKIRYRPSKPRRCRWLDRAAGIRKCRAGVPCPLGRCHGGFLDAVSDSRVHEYAQLNGPRGVGNYWELAALCKVGERPDPSRLDDRADVAREIRCNLRQKQNAKSE